MKIPWWVNPWRAYKSSEYRWALRDAKRREIEDALRINLNKILTENERLAREVNLSRTLPGGMPSSATPEFVFIGIPRPDGTKRLWASKELAGTAFSMVTEDGRMSGQPRWKIGAVMANSLTTDGQSYGECIERVLKIWANWLSLAPRLAPPPPPWATAEPKMAINHGQKPAIESGGTGADE